MIRGRLAAAAALLLLPAAVFALPPGLPPAPRAREADHPQPPAPGRFLVAARELQDPNFRETVVLLIDHETEGSWGLIINRPTPVRLADLLPEEKSLRRSEETLLLGGPVSPGRLLVLFRSRRPLHDSRAVFEDVHLTGNPENLRKLGSNRRAVFHLYAGYAGWGPGQLQAEVARGDWHVLPAEADLVFSEHPDAIWESLVRRAPIQVALAR